MADLTFTQKQDFILLKIAGYDAKKQTVYGINIETGKTISIIKDHKQKVQFIRFLATETDRRHAPIGSTVAFYSLTDNQSLQDTFRAEWATTVSKNQTEEIVVAAPVTVSPVINLPNGKTQVKIRILDQTPLHVDTVNDIADVALIAVESSTEISGIRGCIVRTGNMGSDEAFTDNIRLDNTLPLSEQINAHINASKFETFKEVAQNNIREHSGYLEVIGYTDATNANYNDPKNDAKRSKTPNFTNDAPGGGPSFSYAAVVYNKQYKNITQVVALPALKQIKSVVGLVGSHSKIAPSSLPYFIPKEISEVVPSNIKIPPQYSNSKPIDVRKKTNNQGQFTSVQVTIEPSRIDELEHRLTGLSSNGPIVVENEEGDPNVFKGFYFKKGYLEHVSAMLSDLADTPAIYTVEQSGKLIVLGRTDQEPFNSALNKIAIAEKGIEDETSAFTFPLENKDSVINGLGDLLEMRANVPATVFVTPKVIEEKKQHTSTAKISFKDWHEERYGSSSKGIGDDQESAISNAAETIGIDWSETKHNIDWPLIGQKTSHGKNNAIPLDTKHKVYVNISYKKSYDYDTPGLSINFQNMETHRGDGFTIQLTKDTYDLYEKLVKNDNYIPKPSQTVQQIAEHQEQIKQNNIIKFADENASKAAKRKIAFNYSIALPPLSGHKVLEQKNIPQAIALLGMKESFNPKYPKIKAALFDVYDIHGDYAGYQEVFEEKIVIGKDKRTGEDKLGNKLFNTGLSKKTAEGIAIGTHRVVGEISNVPHTILYAEGYANAVSNTLATGHPSVICLDVANIKNVIALMKKKYPNHTHIQVADNDISSIKKGNIGMLSALDNSYNLDIGIVQPNIKEINSNEKISDTSDIYVHLGVDVLAANLNNVINPPTDQFAYHAERLLYVADNNLERQLTLTLKSFEEEDGQTQNADLILLSKQLLESRNSHYIDSATYEPSVTAEELTSQYIDNIRGKYRGVSNPIYGDVVIPPVAESLAIKIVSEQTKPMTGAERSVQEQITNKVSPYPVSVSTAKDPRQNGLHVTRISSPDGSYNEAIIGLLRSNSVPFHRNPDEKSFTADVKYSNLINSALSNLTGAPELYSTRLKINDKGTTSVVVRGNFGDSALRQKMEVVSGKKYDESNKGFVFESVNDYIFVKEALKHHFTSKNPIISEIEAVRFSEENVDLRAGIYKIADIFSKPSSAIAQSHVYMRIHNPRLASFQSPLLAALYGETREAVRNIENFSQLDENRKLDAVMHQLKREILGFMGTNPEISAKYSQHLSGALSIIDSQQTIDPISELTEVAKDTPEKAVEAIQALPLTEQHSLHLRIANYIEVPSENTNLVSEELEVAEELARITTVATENVEYSPQEEIVVSVSQELQLAEEVSAALPVDEVENRLTKLYENIKNYVEAKFNEYEFEEALKEPGSSHYDIGMGFNRKQFLDDINVITESSLSEKFGKLDGYSAVYVFNAVKKQLINERLTWMKTIFNKALSTDANYNAYGIASKFSQKNVYGLLNPYVDHYNKEDVESNGKRVAAYDREMLADDLLTIDGQVDITTAAGYFKVIQAEYQRNNRFESPIDEIDYKLGTNLAGYIRYISPVTENGIDYFIVDDVSSEKTTSSLMVEGDNGLEAIENVRFEALVHKTFTNNTGFSEARSISIGKSRIYQAIQIDVEDNHKKSSFATIPNDAIAMVNRWFKNSSHNEEVIELRDEPVAEPSRETSSIPVAFEALFIESIDANLSYNDFYSEVFSKTGTLFNKNPYVVDGELDKVAIKNALKEAGFKSPKSMFDGIALKMIEKQEELPPLAQRDTGLITEYNPKRQLSETYTKIDELLSESGVIDLNLAEVIINGTALSWVSNPISSVLVHEILHEDLTQVSAKYLQDAYSADAIKLLLDVNSVPSDTFNSLNTLITQHHSINNIIEMGFDGFMDLDLQTKEEMAKEVGVRRIVGSPRDIAHSVFTRIDDVHEMSALRNTQYSFIKAAVTIEKSGGKIPASAIRQLNRLLNNESLYRPVILQTIKQVELNQIELITDAAYAHIEGMDVKAIAKAISQSSDDNELVLRTALAKVQFADASPERGALDFTTFKYKYYTGSNNSSGLDVTPSYYVKDSVNLISTNEPLSFSEMVDGGIYPANPNAYAAMFAESTENAMGGAAVLTNPNGDIITIHNANNKFIISQLNQITGVSPFGSSEHDNYESALAEVFSNVSPSEYIFDFISKDNVIETLLDNMGLNKDDVNQISSMLSTDNQLSQKLAAEIIDKASELNLPAVQTGDITLDAQQIVESSYRYARINAIADIVSLDGVESSPEISLLKFALRDIEPSALKAPEAMNDVEIALETLLGSLSDENLIDLQAAQVVDERINLLKPEDTVEIERLVSALEQQFEIPESSVKDILTPDDAIIIETPTEKELSDLGELLSEASEPKKTSEHIEQLIDTRQNKTLIEIEKAAISFNNEHLNDFSDAFEGDVVIGRDNGNVTFGFVTKDQTVSPYRYQDIDIRAYPDTLIVKGFVDNAIENDVPLFALTFNEIYNELSSDKAAQFSPNIQDIVESINDSVNNPVSENSQIEPILAEAAELLTMSVDDYVDSFRTLSNLPVDPILLTDDESILIVLITGGSTLNDVNNWLEVQRVSIRGALAAHLYEEGQNAEMLRFGLKGTASNTNNHVKNLKITDIEKPVTINPVEIRAKLTGNITLNKLISDISEPTDVQELLTELVLSPDNITLVEDIISNGFVNTENTVIENNQWQDLPLAGEVLAAPMSAEQVTQSTKGNKIYARSDEVLFIGLNDELEFGLILKDTFEVDQKVIITDLEGKAIDTVSVVNTSTNIEDIHRDAGIELETFTKGQTLFIGDEISIDTLLGERELFGDALLAVYLAKNIFNNEKRLDIDLLSVPDGYEVILDDDYYGLSRVDDLSAIEEVGTYLTMPELRKAILVAKRSNVFNEEKTNDNIRTEPTRGALTASPSTVLPNEVNTTESRTNVGDIFEDNAVRSLGDDRIDTISNTGSSTEPKSTVISSEHDSQPHIINGSDDASEDINISSNGNKRAIDFTPNVTFTYDDELIGLLTKALTIKGTYDVNIAAIKLAKSITKENRTATHEEKRTLAQYRGWGGAKAIFGQTYQHSDKRTELAEWLTPEEYESARRSVLSAFYTSPHIAKATWSILTRLGIKEGVGLEPSFGTGNFAATMPAELQKTSALQARELDTLTGEISAHIHGDLVKTAGFETTNFPSNHFDFSIGNIPFGDYKVYDRNHKDMSSHLIHDYFILKMIDKVKPGGFVPVLTSSGTMDKKSDVVRQKISKEADLVGAIRLPNSAFKDNSGTEALIDLLVFQKRAPNTEPSNTDWLNVSDMSMPTAHSSYQIKELPVNDYFINNKEMVLGNIIAKSSRFGFEVGVMSSEEDKYMKAPDIVPLLNAVIEHFPEDIHFEYSPEPVAFIPRKANVDLMKEQSSQGKLGGYVINSKGNVAQIELEVFFNSETLESEEKLVSVEVDLPKTKTDRLAALISLKEATLIHLELMVSTLSSDSDIETSMKALSTQYDAVTKKYKELNSRANKSIFKADPESGVLLSLEHYDRQNKTATKADIFTERTVFPNKVFENIEDPQEAVLISLAEYGGIIPDYVMQLTNKNWNAITSELSGRIFENPETGGWDTENAYLSGNVRQKLKAAVAAAAIDEKFKLNVDYLKDVIPEAIPYFEIRAKLGSDWLPPTDIQDFYKFIFMGDDAPCSPSERADFSVTKVNAQWFTNISKSIVSRYQGNTKTAFGTEVWDAGRLIDAALNNSPVKVTNTDGDGKRYTLIEETASALEKLDVIKESFKTWLWSSEQRSVRLEGLYNELRNAYVEPKFDGSKIQFNGLSPYLAGQEFSPRENQKNAVMRYLTTGKSLFIHDVGVGKSFTLLASIMKGHEVGRHTKPVLAVPKSVFPQMQSLALSHFPNAKILMLDAVKTTDPKEKAVIINKIAMNNWDMIILPHTVLPKLDVPMDFKLKLIDEELDLIEQSLSMLNDEGFSAKSSLSSMQSRLEKEKANLLRALDENESYDALNIAELGIDAIFVDEADEFVNLKKISRLNAIKGVGAAQSNRATALHRITEYLHREIKDAGVVLATGTDIRNNMADLYTLMRFTDPSLLEENGVMMFDDFVGSFGDIQTQFEIAPEGSGYIEVTRLNKFINIPELLMMYRQVADVVTAEQAGVVRPKIEEIHVKGEQCEYLEAYMGVLAHRAERSRNGSPVFENDNLLAITGGGRKSSLSMSLIDPMIPFNADSKVGQCITNVAQVYNDNLAMKPSQIIFCDMGVPNKDGRFDLYNQIKSKLIESGIPEAKVVFARDFNTDIRKQDLQDRMNSGDISVCIGSTENMGVGKNVQKRLAAIHDLSIPWRYRDMVQRLGRIERFGNLFPDAKRFIYITEDSFDLFIFQKVMQKAEITLQAKLSPRDSVREFVDDVEPKHADIMALGTSNPIIQKAIEVESSIIKLEIAEKSFHKSLINLRSNKNEATRVLSYANDRVIELDNIIKVVELNPIIFGDKIMKTKDDVDSVAKALNKAIKASLKDPSNERVFKVGNVGEADIVINAKFNGRFAAYIKTKDLTEEITEGAYLKTVVDEMTYCLMPELNSQLAQAHKTIVNQEIKIGNLEAQSIENTFPKAQELQELRLEHKGIEVEKAMLLNDTVEYSDPMEKFENLVHELKLSSPNEMIQSKDIKDNWEPDFEIKLEPVS